MSDVLATYARPLAFLCPRQMVFCQTKCLNSVHQLIDVRTVGQGGKGFESEEGLPEGDVKEEGAGSSAERSASEAAAVSKGFVNLVQAIRSRLRSPGWDAV